MYFYSKILYNKTLKNIILTKKLKKNLRNAIF